MLQGCILLHRIHSSRWLSRAIQQRLKRCVGGQQPLPAIQATRSCPGSAAESTPPVFVNCSCRSGTKRARCKRTACWRISSAGALVHTHTYIHTHTHTHTTHITHRTKTSWPWLRTPLQRWERLHGICSPVCAQGEFGSRHFHVPALCVLPSTETHWHFVARRVGKIQALQAVLQKMAQGC